MGATLGLVRTVCSFSVTSNQTPECASFCSAGDWCVIYGIGAQSQHALYISWSNPRPVRSLEKSGAAVNQFPGGQIHQEIDDEADIVLMHFSHVGPTSRCMLLLSRITESGSTCGFISPPLSAGKKLLHDQQTRLDVGGGFHGFHSCHLGSINCPQIIYTLHVRTIDLNH